MQMKNIPQKIYLQIGQGNEDEPDFSAFSEVTWSADKVFSNDIEFVLQQAPCSMLRELLAQMHTEEFNAFSHATEDDEMKKHSTNMKAIQLVMELIKDFKPVA